jgi:TRAP-type C4-dicarboxylate transport system substrate-binding protein
MSTPMRIALAAGIIAVAVGAANSLAGPPQKTGSVVMLTLGITEARGRPLADIAEVFAARVKALSKGTIVVKIAYESGYSQGKDTPVSLLDANVIGLVRSGKNALAFVPTRAFQGQGVNSFQALQAPFLITTEATMDRVTAGTIAGRLQSGLPKLGLTGLGFAPEGLRRPFGFRKALVSPADFAGIGFRAVRSEQFWALIRLSERGRSTSTDTRWRRRLRKGLSRAQTRRSSSQPMEAFRNRGLRRATSPSFRRSTRSSPTQRR